MTVWPVHPITGAFGFKAFGSQPLGNVGRRPLAESAATFSTGHCQSRRRRTETSRTRNASAALTLHRARPVSVPESAPVGGFTHSAKARRKFLASALPTTIKTARQDVIFPTACTLRGASGGTHTLRGPSPPARAGPHIAPQCLTQASTII
jgi:hypothetical protein